MSTTTRGTTSSIPPLLAALTTALALAGCASVAPPADPFGGGSAQARPVEVEVVNNNFNDATIWAVYPAERIRLGTVSGKSQSTFRMRSRVAQAVHMEIDLVGGGSCVTDRLPVDEGDVLRLEIAVELSAMPGCR